MSSISTCLFQTRLAFLFLFLLLFSPLPSYAIGMDGQESISEGRQDERALLRQTLNSTGITKPVVLDEPGQSREFYLPLPRSAPIENARLHFHARHLADDDTGGTLQLLVDGEPVYASAYTSKHGEIDLELPIPQRSTAGSFLRLGVKWMSNKVLHACEVAPPSANSLVINPSTGISYSVLASEPLDLASAWQLTPAQGILTLAADAIAAQSFDAAWRVGTAFELGGKNVRLQAMLAVGDAVGLKDLELPAGLRTHPVAGSLVDDASSKIVVQTQAQIGALLLLRTEAVLGNVVIFDEAMATQITTALDAFGQTLSSTVDKRWFAQAVKAAKLDFAGGQPADNIFLLGSMPSRIIAIRPDAGKDAAVLFSQRWVGLLTMESVAIEEIQAQPLNSAQAIRLKRLGAMTQSFDVVNHAAWQTDFSFRSVDFNGRVPHQLMLDVAAAPDTSGTRPVMSVTWNDILLTAARLRADGEKEHIVARIPFYAVGQENSIRIALQRQPSANGCAELQSGFPFNVLPTSFISTQEPYIDSSFAGIMPLLADKAELAAPEQWLDNAPGHLLQIIRLATASGLSPHRADLKLIASDQAYVPEKAFIAMGVPVASVKPKVQVDEDGRLIIEGEEAPLLEIAGLRDLSSVEVMRSGPFQGLYWTGLPFSDAHQPFGGDELMPYMLDRGDIALVAPNGIVAWMDSTDPTFITVPERINSIFYEWRRVLTWGIPIMLGGLFVMLILVAMAYRAGRRRETK